jgi:hypothetical protein
MRLLLDTSHLSIPCEPPGSQTLPDVRQTSRNILTPAKIFSSTPPPQTRRRGALDPAGAAARPRVLLRLSAPSEVVGSSAGAFEYLSVRRLQSCGSPCSPRRGSTRTSGDHGQAFRRREVRDQRPADMVRRTCATRNTTALVLHGRYGRMREGGVRLQVLRRFEDGRVVCSKNEL